MKTMVFEVYDNDDYTCCPIWFKRNVPDDADMEDVIMMFREQNFCVADIVDVYDAVDAD